MTKKLAKKEVDINTKLVEELLSKASQSFWSQSFILRKLLYFLIPVNHA